MYGLFAKTLTKGDRRKEELKQTNKNCKNERGKGYAEQRARTVSSLAPHHHSRVITQVITVSSRASVAPWPSLALFSKAFHHPLSFPSFIAGLVIFPSQLRQSIFLLSPSPIPPLLPCLSLVLFGHTSCLTASRYTLPLQDPSAKLVNHSSILWPVMKRGSVVTCGWPGPPTWSTRSRAIFTSAGPPRNTPTPAPSAWHPHVNSGLLTCARVISSILIAVTLSGSFRRQHSRRRVWSFLIPWIFLRLRSRSSSYPLLVHLLILHYFSLLLLLRYFSLFHIFSVIFFFAVPRRLVEKHAPF